MPLLLLAVYCINAIVAAIRGRVVMVDETYNFLLKTKHYLAFVAIVVDLLTYFLLRPFYKYTLGLTIGLGLLNIMVFPALEVTQSFALGSLKVSFQPSAFFAGLVVYLINFKRINEFLIEHLITKGTPKEQKNVRAKFVEDVERFKVKYNNYSVEDLAEIVTENKFVPEAIEAARQLIKERRPDEKIK